MIIADTADADDDDSDLPADSVSEIESDSESKYTPLTPRMKKNLLTMFLILEWFPFEV